MAAPYPDQGVAPVLRGCEHGVVPSQGGEGGIEDGVIDLRTVAAHEDGSLVVFQRAGQGVMHPGAQVDAVLRPQRAPVTGELPGASFIGRIREPQLDPAGQIAGRGIQRMVEQAGVQPCSAPRAQSGDETGLHPARDRAAAEHQQASSGLVHR